MGRGGLERSRRRSRKGRSLAGVLGDCSVTFARKARRGAKARDSNARRTMNSASKMRLMMRFMRVERGLQKGREIDRRIAAGALTAEEAESRFVAWDSNFQSVAKETRSALARAHGLTLRELGAEFTEFKTALAHMRTRDEYRAQEDKAAAKRREQRAAERAKSEAALARSVATAAAEQRKKERAAASAARAEAVAAAAVAAAKAAAQEEARLAGKRLTRAEERRRAEERQRDEFVSKSDDAGHCCRCGVAKSGMQGGNFKRHVRSCKGPGLTNAEHIAAVAWDATDRQQSKASSWTKKRRARLLAFMRRKKTSVFSSLAGEVGEDVFTATTAKLVADVLGKAAAARKKAE